MKRLRRSLGLACVVLLLASPACVFQNEDDDDADLTEIDVSVQAFDFYFEPTTVLLEPGAQANITFENAGEAAHSFTIPDLDVEVEAEGAETVTTSFVTPDEPGAYEFICKFHSQMTGAVSIGQDDDDVETETETETETEG